MVAATSTAITATARVREKAIVATKTSRAIMNTCLDDTFGGNQSSGGRHRQTDAYTELHIVATLPTQQRGIPNISMENI